MIFLHVGRKAPKGWKELRSIHLGNNVWMISCVPDVQKQTRVKAKIHYGLQPFEINGEKN